MSILQVNVLFASVELKVKFAVVKFVTADGLPVIDVSGGVASSDKSAFSMRMRGLVKPLRVSRIGRPVVCRALSAWFTVNVGRACLISANAPVTCGVAMDVP